MNDRLPPKSEAFIDVDTRRRAWTTTFATSLSNNPYPVLHARYPDMPVITIAEAIQDASEHRVLQASATADLVLESAASTELMQPATIFDDSHSIIRALFPGHSIYFWIALAFLIAAVFARLLLKLLFHMREKYPADREPLLVTDVERQWLKRRWGITVDEEIVEGESPAALLLRERRLQRNLREMGLL